MSLSESRLGRIRSLSIREHVASTTAEDPTLLAGALLDAKAGRYGIERTPGQSDHSLRLATFREALSRHEIDPAMELLLGRTLGGKLDEFQQQAVRQLINTNIELGNKILHPPILNALFEQANPQPKPSNT